MQTEDPNDAPGWEPCGPRWGGLNHLLRTAGPFSTGLSVDGASATQRFMRETCKLLVIGAGGLGCEILKDVALSGIRNISVVDLDVIDVTNLNRQFLFRDADVGKPKATVAAAFINRRVPGANVTPYHANIMDFDKDFYRQFHLVIGGLDSIDARRWLNAMLIDLVEHDESGQVIQSSIVPFIDGGTEGFQGQARVILPKLSACFECTLSLFPPTKNFPLCTIANTPRLPEHCVEYVNVVLWDKEKPFGPEQKLDPDNPEHMMWVFEKANARANEFGIANVTYRLAQGVVKNIIPAIASTNAIIAAACAHEALKMLTHIADYMDNYMMYNGNVGVYAFTFRNEKRTDCPVCGVPAVRDITFPGGSALSEFLEFVANDGDLRSRNPFLRTSEGKTLFASAPVMLRKATEANLERKMAELVSSGSRLVLTDRNLPTSRTITLNLS